MSNSPTLSADQPTPTAEEVPTAVHNLLAAINADDAEAMATALQRIENEQGQAGAAAIAGAVVPAGLTKKLLDALAKRAESLNTADAWRQAAEAAFVLQDVDLVQRAANETLKHDPTVTNAAFMLAVIANRQARYDEALKAINSLLPVVPQAKNDPYMIVQLALAQIGTNQPQTALSILDDSIDELTAAGLGFDGELLRARALRTAPERTPDALAAYKRALAVATPAQAPSARDEYTAELIKARHFTEALTQLALLLEVADQSTVLGLRETRAKILAEIGDIDGAVAEVDASLGITGDPGQRVNLLLFQARLEASRQHWKESADRYNEALKEASNQTEPGIERSAIQLEKAQRLGPQNINLVLADLDELDTSLTGPGWPLSIDIRINGLVTAGRPEEALAWLNKRLAAAPQLADHPAAHQVRAEIDMKLGNVEAAIEQYAQAVSIPPGQSDPRAWGAALVGAITTQQWDKATAIYEQFFKTNPAADEAAMRVFVAVAYARNNQPEKALELTEQEESLPPHIAALRRQARAEAQMRLGRYEAVLQTIDEDALRGAGATPDVLLAAQLMRIQALNQLEKFAEARSEATRALDSFSDSASSLAGLMPLLRLSVRVQRSLACYSLAKFADAHTDINAAISEFEQVRLTPAAKVLETAPEFTSLESSMWFAKGAVLEAENRGDESLTAFTRSFALETTGAAAAIARGNALSNVEAFTEAVDAFDVALSRVKTPKERATALAGKGLALVRLRKHEEAIGVMRAAVDARLTEPADGPAIAAANAIMFEHLGIAYNALERNGAALNAFGSAWNLITENKRESRKANNGPGSAWNLTDEDRRYKSKANVARGIFTAHLKMGFPTTALKFFETLPDDLRTEPTLMFNRALALMATGNRSDALEILVRAKNAGLSEAQELLERLDRPSGLNRWTRDWFGVQASSARRRLGFALLLLAGLGLLAPFYQWWVASKLDWYWLLIPSVAALILFALPSLRSIKAAGVELSAAEPLPATGRDASTSQTSNLPTSTVPIAPK